MKKVEKTPNFIELEEEVLHFWIHRLSKSLFNFYLEADNGYEVATTPELVVGLETIIDDVLLEEGLLREFIRELQILRRNQGFKINNRIHLSIFSSSRKIQNILFDKNHRQLINQELLVSFFEVKTDIKEATTLQVDEHEIQVNIAKVS